MNDSRKYIPKIGDRVLFFDPTDDFCREAKLDVGKIGIIKEVRGDGVELHLPDCHSGNGKYWWTDVNSIKPVEQQLMLFEL